MSRGWLRVREAFNSNLENCENYEKGESICHGAGIDSPCS